jgi:hypothetical protein
MPGKLGADTAAAFMRDAGVEPIEPYCNSSAPWRCRCQRCGREVTPRLDNVRAGHAACRYCVGSAVDPADAARTVKAAGMTPLGLYPGASRPWRCRCVRCGREVRPRYAAVVKGSGCRYCAQDNAGQARRLDAQQTATVMRGVGMVPLEPYPGARRPWRCTCLRCGRMVAPRYADVKRGHDGCRWCAWRTSAATQRMEHETAVRVMIAKGLEPVEQYPGAGKVWRCRCLTCGARVTPRYSNVRQGWGGCRRCAGRAASERQRGDETDAARVMDAAGLQPLAPYPGVMQPWRSQCRICGKEVTPLLNNIKKGSGGCGWCAGNRIDPKAACAVMRAAGLEPLVAYPGRHSPWLCNCQRCGQTVTPRYGAVQHGGGCRYCNDTAIKPDTAVALMRTVNLEPLVPYPGSQRKWKCQCLKCNRVVNPRYSTIQQSNGGCRWCRNSGFNAATKAVVYLITHPDHHAAKIGITDQSGVRLRRHRTHGWHVLGTATVSGKIALDIEADILDWWRGELGLPAYLGPYEMPQGGWTETVGADEIDLAATLRRIRQAIPTM